MRLYCVKKQIGNRIWSLRKDGEWTKARHFMPWLGSEFEALSKMRARRILEDDKSARYYIEPTDWEELSI